MSIGELRQKLLGRTVASVTEAAPESGCAGYTLKFDDGSTLLTQWCGPDSAVKYMDGAGKTTTVEPEKTGGTPLMELVS